MRPGENFECVSCDAMVVVIGTARTDGVLLCCSVPMRVARPVPCSVRPDTTPEHGVVAGVRYADPISGLRVRCTRSGKGPFEFGHRRLASEPTAMAGRSCATSETRYVKPLPSPPSGFAQVTPAVLRRGSQ